MMFLLAYMMLFFGVVLAGIVGLVPANQQAVIPVYFRYILFMMGSLISFIGLVLIHGRAKKTGAHHLIEPGRPGLINWFLVYPDGDIKITPSVRDVEGQLYSKELDAQIQELKSYRIFDHSIRFVLEGTGHAADLGMCVYTKLLKTKYGFENLRQARQGGFNLFGFPKKVTVAGQEEAYLPEDYDPEKERDVYR